jgi:hypothetical protein
MAKVESQQRLEFLDGQTCLPDDGTQGPFGHLVMIRDRKAPVRRSRLPKDDVATLLGVELISDLAQGLDYLAARDAR